MKRQIDKKKEVVLFGYGKFGRQMYNRLVQNGHHVILATSKESNFEDAVRDNIQDIRHFTPKRNDSIKMLGIDPAKQLLYCAMDHTSNNLFLVLSLRELYRDAVIVAVSNSEENQRKLKYAGADTVIDIYDASAQHLVTNLTKPAVAEALNNIIFENNELKVAEIKLEPGTFLDQKSASQIDFYSRGLIMIAIIDKELGDDLIYASRGIDHKFDAGDTLIVAGRIEDIVAFKKELEG
ncbi:MAG TPA: TrkA family potassium uptake protein [Campylobacteraceae bacterium]|nr:TrkA family potassium uptake protein [Campylobacteraceae bacterium]HHD83833.1 TrkA family potassium uptake protein [Campylobacteraceae bacterium]